MKGKQSGGVLKARESMLRSRSVLKVIDKHKLLRGRPVDTFVRVPGIPGHWRVGGGGALVTLFPSSRAAVKRCGDRVVGIVVDGHRM